MKASYRVPMAGTLGEMLRLSAARYPHRTALVFGQKKISYRALDETTDRLAAGLIELGIKKQERAALFLDNCPEFIIAYYALLKAGAVVVPINYMFKKDEVKFILEDSTAACLITSRANLALAQDLHLRVDTLRHVIISSKANEAHLDFPRLKKETPQNLTPVTVSSGQTAVILYTSGTTGHPKGAMLTHANLISNAFDASRAISADCHDTFICILPLFHSFAATVCMNLPLLVGARTVIMKSIRPFKRLIRAIRKNRVSIFVAIPSIYSILKDLKLPRIFHTPLIKLFNPVKACISGAAALPQETFRGFEKKFRVPLLEGYGLTEASPVVTLNPLKGRRKAGSIGIPLAKTIDLRIVNERGDTLAPGHVGELLVRGPNVMVGYFNQTEATKEALRDGWLSTGDMAQIDADGYVFIAGRKKEMVNVRGLNVYPREIEELLYQNPKIKEAAVIGIADEHKGEVPKAFVVLHETQIATEQEIIRYLRQHLASYKIPKHVEFRKSLPKNTTGKIMKRILENESHTS